VSKNVEVVHWYHVLSGYKEAGAAWMPAAPPQYVSANVGHEMMEKHHRHHSSVFNGFCPLDINNCISLVIYHTNCTFNKAAIYKFSL